MTVYIVDGAERIECVLLAVFDVEKEVYENTNWVYRKKASVPPEYEHKALVFIPWKHSMKELRIVDREQVLFGDVAPSGANSVFIDASEYVSPFEQEMPGYYDEYRIKNYCGYGFIYEYRNFIADVYQHCDEHCLELLYKNLPELLTLDNGE